MTYYVQEDSFNKFQNKINYKIWGSVKISQLESK